MLNYVKGVTFFWQKEKNVPEEAHFSSIIGDKI